MRLFLSSAGSGDALSSREAYLELPVIAQSPLLRTISALPSTAVAIDRQHAHTAATVEATRQAQKELTTITDTIIEEIEQLCRERLLLVELYRRQITAWRRIALQAAEVAETDRLDAILDAETAIVAEGLAVAREIYGGTAEEAVRKSAFELHLETLLRSAPEQRPNRVRPRYNQTRAGFLA